MHLIDKFQNEKCSIHFLVEPYSLTRNGVLVFCHQNYLYKHAHDVIYVNSLQPWQVVLQTLETDPRKANGEKYVVDTTVYTSDNRPTYNEAVAKLVEANAQRYEQQ